MREARERDGASLSPPSANLVDVQQQVGGVLVDPERARILKLVEPIAAAENPDTERTAACGRQRVPDAVANDDRRFDRCSELLGRRQKQIRIRLGVFDLIARNDRRLFRIDAERRQIEAGGFHPPAGCNRPRDARVRQKRQQLARAWQRSDVAGVVPVGGQVPLAQPFDTFDADVEPGFSQQLIGKQVVAALYCP